MGRQSQAVGLMMDIAKGGSNLEYNFHECIIKKNTRCINMNSQNPRTQGSTFCRVVLHESYTFSVSHYPQNL